jgi:DNA gyrase subunit A
VATLLANTRDLLYFVTLKGRAATVPVYALPEREDPAGGAPWSSVSGLDVSSRVVAVVAINPDLARRVAEAKAAANGDGTDGANGNSAYILLGTANGMVKKTSIGDLPGVSSQVYNLINVAEDDAVIAARLTTGSDEILLVTALGRAIRFKEDEVRAMGLVAAGVVGIKPGERDDKVIGLDVVQPKGEVFMLTDLGMGKRTPVKDFPTQGRYGMGVTAALLVARQRLAGMLIGEPDDRLTVVTTKGVKAIKLDAAGRRGRAARGSAVLKLKGGEAVVRLVAMQPQFSLPEPETPPAPPKSKRNGSGRAAKSARPAKNGKAAKPARVSAKRPAKNGNKPSRRK